MDPRISFFQNLIEDQTKRILELGPLNRPIADKEFYHNAYYCDVRSTEEVRKLYSGNDYLEATGIMVNPETIVPIDFVIKGNYEETFKEVEKFDYIIASHVMEHMEDIIFALRDISTVLKPEGVLYLVYPDKRYCFDHFRTSASFRDAYNVFRNGTKENAPMVFDFYYSVIPENRPYIFWGKEGILDYLPEAVFENAVEHYEKALQGVKMDDVHYWPFSDMDFLKFLYDCTRARLIPFRCIAFQPCMENDQQFMVALQYAPDVLSHPEQALRELKQHMENAIPDYFSSKTLMMWRENEDLRNSGNQQKKVIELQGKALYLLENQVDMQNKKMQEQEEAIHNLKSQLEEYKEIIKEQDYIISSLSTP